MQLKYFIPFLLALACGYTTAQAQNVPDLNTTQPAGAATTITQPPALNSVGAPSWIRTFVPKVPISDAGYIQVGGNPAEVQVATAYKDGFNRTLQTVQHNFTANGNSNLIQIADNRFQPGETGYLPYASASDAFNINMFSAQNSYISGLYPGEAYTGYSRSLNLSDASQRAVKTLSPGRSQTGQNRGVTVKQTTNAANEVKLWELDGSGAPVSSGSYGAGMLFGQQVYDTTGALVTSYTDRDGRVVCKTVKLESQSVGQNTLMIYGTTQYIYDDMGRLAFTLPPKASDLANGSTISQAILDNLCFQYRYDSKGRLAAQRFPGEQGFTEVVYDNKQRAIMRRSPNEAVASQWEITFYDAQGRLKATSILGSNSNTRDYWQGIMDAGSGSTNPADLTYYLLTAAGAAAYPAENAIANNTMMSYSYYDDYSLVDDPSETLWNSCTGTLNFSQLATTAGAETPVRSKRTHGMPTGGKVRILKSPSAQADKTGEWRMSAIWYDDKGRPVNSASRDLYQGTPIHVTYSGSQYDFSGKVLMSKVYTYNASSTDANSVTSHTELYRNEYEMNTGRLSKVSHRMDNSSWQVLGMYQYDELGRAKRNVLGNYGEVQDMQYNIRGQLTGINATYAETGNREGESRSFGESLKYDYGFTAPGYDGKIAGMVWRGSGSAHAYGYSYDYSGRLRRADFRKLEPAGGGYLAPAWRNDQTDYSVSNLAYDLNGNIRSMKQKGMNNGAIATLDDLDYQYSTGSNQLLKVQDPQPDYGTGDFVNTNGSGDDYAYDADGNLEKDVNKGITSVTYTHFNKPQVVSFGGGKKIEYSYDAAGNKIQELVIDPTAVSPLPTTKRTDYIGNNVYQDDKVQYALTGPGRTTFDPANGMPKEEFFVKDHLGNVRSVVDVYVYPMVEYLATYEVASANLENMFFENVDEIRDDRPGATWNGDLKSARLNGADEERRVGTSALLKVMAGDKVEMNVNNFYENYDAQQDSPLNLEDVLGSVTGALSSGIGGTMAGEAHNTRLVEDAFNMANFTTFNNMVQGNADPSKPKAFLNYILFDEQMRIVESSSGAFQANGNGTWTQIGTTVPLEIPLNGYLAVYLSNGSRMVNCLACADVFFDQLVLRFTRGSLKEESHYYPFGLPMAGMGSAAAGFKENRKRYQSNDYNKDLGLNWMDFQARQYDPQLGRFLGVDPLADITDDMSPYTAMNNAPESLVDPEGLTATVASMTLQETVQFMTAMNTMFGANNWGLDNGHIVMLNSTAASAAFSSFLGSGQGGGCFATSQTMAFIGNQIWASHNDPNKNIAVGVAGNEFWAGPDGGILAEAEIVEKKLQLIEPYQHKTAIDGITYTAYRNTPYGEKMAAEARAELNYYFQRYTPLGKAVSAVMAVEEVASGMRLSQESGNTEKTADEILPATLKRSPSYSPNHGGYTRSELAQLAKDGDLKAGKMKKLVDQVPRLMDKLKSK